MGRPVRAEPRVKLEMRALDQQMVVHRAEDRAETIGIVPFPDAALVFGAQPIGGEGAAWPAETLEKAGVAARLERRWRRHPANGAQVRRAPGAKARTAQPPSCLVRPEHGERIGMPARRRSLRRRRRSEARPFHDVMTWRTGTFQISSAYSAIVRSDENQPVRAVLRMAERHQDLRSRQRRDDRVLRVDIGVEIGRHQEIVVIGQHVDQRRVAVAVVRREGAVGDRRPAPPAASASASMVSRASMPRGARAADLLRRQAEDEDIVVADPLA